MLLSASARWRLSVPRRSSLAICRLVLHPQWFTLIGLSVTCRPESMSILDPTLRLKSIILVIHRRLLLGWRVKYIRLVTWSYLFESMNPPLLLLTGLLFHREMFPWQGYHYTTRSDVANGQVLETIFKLNRLRSSVTFIRRTVITIRDCMLSWETCPEIPRKVVSHSIHSGKVCLVFKTLCFVLRFQFATCASRFAIRQHWRIQ